MTKTMIVTATKTPATAAASDMLERDFYLGYVQLMARTENINA